MNPATCLRAAWPVLTAALVIAAVACGDPAPAARAPEGASDPADPTPRSAMSIRELVPLLTRHGIGPRNVAIDVIFAPPLFYEITGTSPPASATARSTLIFIVQENIHEGDLLDSTPVRVFLQLDNGTRIAPLESMITSEDPHHRASRVLFERPPGWPREPRPEDGIVVRLVAPMADGLVATENTFEWQLPVEPEGGARPVGEVRRK